MDISQLKIAKLVSENQQGRDFIVADLHGCYDALMRALGKAGFDRRCDRLFALGDIIDRGKSSYDSLLLVREPWFYSVLGNHEYLMLSALRRGARSNAWQNWMNNGAEWFSGLNEKQYDHVISLLPDLLQLPVTLTVTTNSGKRVGLSHAQPPSYDWDAFISGRQSHDEQMTEKQIWRALWGRDIIRSRIVARVQGVDATFHGHTIVNSPLLLGNMRFIDTGAYLDNRVTLIELNDRLLSSGSKAA